jgi:hypothetical protein
LPSAISIKFAWWTCDRTIPLFPLFGATGANDPCICQGLAGARGTLDRAADGAAVTLAVATGAWFDDVPQPAKVEMMTAAMMTSLLPAQDCKMSMNCLRRSPFDVVARRSDSLARICERQAPYAFMNLKREWARNMPQNFKANGTITVLEFVRILILKA